MLYQSPPAQRRSAPVPPRLSSGFCAWLRAAALSFGDLEGLLSISKSYGLNLVWTLREDLRIAFLNLKSAIFRFFLPGEEVFLEIVDIMSTFKFLWLSFYPFIIIDLWKSGSVYLNLVPSDNRLTLVWNEAVPWNNSQHVIYRQNPFTLNFDSIDITSNTNYVDTGLANGTTYCYKVKSI